MRGITAHQPFVPRHGLGQQITADVARRQPIGAQAGNHDVRKILAHPFALGQCDACRRVDFRAFTFINEITVDALHQVPCCQQQGLAGGKTRSRVVGKIGMPRYIGRGKYKFSGSVIGVLRTIAKALTDLLPSQRALHVWWPLGCDQAAGDYLELRVRGLQREEQARIAVHIQYGSLLGRLRFNIQLVAQQLLVAGVARSQIGHVLRNVHRWRVVVAGLVGNVQFHSKPSAYAPRLCPASPEWVK